MIFRRLMMAPVFFFVLFLFSPGCIVRWNADGRCEGYDGQDHCYCQ